MENYDLRLKDGTESAPSVVVTPVMIDHLKATRPWVRSLSVLMFAIVVFILLSTLVQRWNAAAYGSGGRSSGFASLFSLVVGLVYLFPAYFLHQYASAINDLLRGGGDVAMEAALGSQKSFWRFTGIVTLVLFCIYAFSVMIALYEMVTSK
jgi:hypothetical protein